MISGSQKLLFCCLLSFGASVRASAAHVWIGGFVWFCVVVFVFCGVLFVYFVKMGKGAKNGAAGGGGVTSPPAAAGEALVLTALSASAGGTP